MKHFIFLFFILSLCLFPLSRISASETDVLIEKLVEKGVLSEKDAKDMVDEIKNEGKKDEEAVKKVATEAATQVAKKDSGFKLPDWVNKITPYGDLRLRHDTQWTEKADTAGVTTQDNTRNRERFRLRAGLDVQTSETTKMGFGLASGDGMQNTTNQSFDGHGRGKDIFIDLAYAKWDPCNYFTVQGGKHKNHLFTTPLVWDGDVNPEGLAETFKYSISDNITLFSNLGQWVLEEQSSTNDDPWLLAYQLGTTIVPADTVQIDVAASYYDFMKMDRIKHDDDDIDDDETFIGYNNGSQQMVFDDQGRLLNEFGVLELQAKAKFKGILPVPFSIFGSYITNLDADMDELTGKGVAYTDTNPADLLSYGGDDRDMGWLIGFDLGNKKKKGDWYFEYWYQVLEDYAFPAVFVDSDFHSGGTNNKGHKIHARYLFTDQISAQASGYITEREDENKDGKFDENRIQLDLIFAY